MKKFLLLLLLTIACYGQNKTTDERFFNKGNIIRFSFAAGGMALDAYSTQRFLSPVVQDKEKYQYQPRPYEINPIARPFVNRGWGGQLEASSLSLAVTVGASYIFHKTNHQKIEHAIPIVTGLLSWTAGAANMRF